MKNAFGEQCSEKVSTEGPRISRPEESSGKAKRLEKGLIEILQKNLIYSKHVQRFCQFDGEKSHVMRRFSNCLDLDNGPRALSTSSFQSTGDSNWKLFDHLESLIIIAYGNFGRRSLGWRFDSLAENGRCVSLD